MARKKSFFQQKILITGGSGSLGRHLIRELLNRGASKIISVSRDEGLIKQAAQWLNSPKVQFRIGDISDSQSMKRLLEDVDIIYNTAALKDVPISERYPREVLKINILGILNILDNSSNVKRFVNISSDKAIGIINCYGASKLFAEYLVRDTNNFYKGTFANIRCPNFLGSRGSVLDVWKQQIEENNEIQVTDPNMTRFFVTLSDGAKFIVDISSQQKLDTNKIYYPIQYSHKFILKDLVKAFLQVNGNKNTKINYIGKRVGEKVHEDYAESIPLTPFTKLVEMLRKLEQ